MKYKFLIIALLFCATVKAQTIPNITPSHLKAAEELLVASGADMQFKETTAAMLKQLSANVPEDKKQKFLEIMNSFINKYMNWDLMKDQMAALYAQEFTEKELRDLAVFYRTPLGIKVNQKQPVLFQKSALLGQQAVQGHQVELQQMMREAFNEK
ncbi:DUF2059 domain-containing protein [Mucilaginibacter terrigena]|uniref:DUF2059 domain-containing protein n=1 Tax=Mucilaginibacter terrigena TaxID=2492395 RepID=A0A4Q5LJT9_9SPHI|nr:DUF2059 domain-containing protein [Mucilaginibacter terrigena]RYU87872.1 DUF2059 domain-containing protein [Mucilaginibacter terrigena]